LTAKLVPLDEVAVIDVPAKIPGPKTCCPTVRLPDSVPLAVRVAPEIAAVTMAPGCVVNVPPKMVTVGAILSV
jgi:hypothetical protein